MSFLGLLKNTCTLQKRVRSQKMTYSASTGTPAVGMTITGATSHKTAVITRLFTNYFVVKSLSGTFTNGETIASGALFSATLGTVTDYSNSTGEPEYYWTDDQTFVPCRFYYPGGTSAGWMTEKGVYVTKSLQVTLPPSITIADCAYRLKTTDANYAGTYEMTFLPKDGRTTLHHHDSVLTKVIGL